MSGDQQEPRSQGEPQRDERSRDQTVEPRDEPRQGGTMSISTADEAVLKPAEMRESPEQVVSYQTSQIHAPPAEYPFESGGDVVRERRGPWQDERQQQDRHQDDRDGGQRGGGKHRRQNEKAGRNGSHDHRHENQHRRPRKSEDKHEPRHEKSIAQPTWKVMLMTAVLALVCGIGGAWGYSALFGPSKSDKQGESSDKGDKGDKGGKSGGKAGGKGDKSGDKKQESGGASASEIPGFSSAHDAETFKKELEHLAHRLDLLGGRIDRLTTNEDKTPPGMHTMQSKMTDLERELDEIARLPSKVGRLEEKLSDLEQELKMLNDRVSGNETPLAGHLAPPSAPAGTSPKRLAADADPANEATLHLASGLLREGHYSQSYQVLRRLQRERPRDARVWYLSALAYGLSQGDWTGKAKQLAEQGASCERAGHPSRRDIDDALAGLSPAAGKAWIASQRKQAQTR